MALQINVYVNIVKEYTFGNKYTNNNYYEVLLDNDYIDQVHFLMSNELKLYGMDSQILTRNESFIVGGENDPELEEYTMRYLLLKPMKN